MDKMKTAREEFKKAVDIFVNAAREAKPKPNKHVLELSQILNMPIEYAYDFCIKFNASPHEVVDFYLAACRLPTSEEIRAFYTVNAGWLGQMAFDDKIKERLI